jgi:hypothetical protein
MADSPTPLVGPWFTNSIEVASKESKTPKRSDQGISSQTLTWIGVSLLVLFVIISTVYWTVPLKNPSKLTSYIGMIGFLGTSIAVIGFFLSQRQIQVSNLQSLNTQREALAQQNSTALTQFVINNWDSLIRVYKQINQDDSALQALDDPVITPKVVGIEILFCGLLAQSMENVVTRLVTSGIPIDSPEYIGYYNSYRKLFNSEIFRRYWSLNSQIYNQYTQDFAKEILAERQQQQNQAW